MQLIAALIEILPEHDRMLRSHLRELTDLPGTRIHLQSFAAGEALAETLKPLRLDKYDALILNHFDEHGSLSETTLQLGRTLLELDRRLLFWSPHATPDNVPAGCLFTARHDPAAAARIIRWLLMPDSICPNELLRSGALAATPPTRCRERYLPALAPGGGAGRFKIPKLLQSHSLGDAGGLTSA